MRQLQGIFSWVRLGSSHSLTPIPTLSKRPSYFCLNFYLDDLLALTLALNLVGVGITELVDRETMVSTTLLTLVGVGRCECECSTGK